MFLNTSAPVRQPGPAQTVTADVFMYPHSGTGSSAPGKFSRLKANAVGKRFFAENVFRESVSRRLDVMSECPARFVLCGRVAVVRFGEAVSPKEETIRKIGAGSEQAEDIKQILIVLAKIRMAAREKRDF